jgi:biopolymer transport protein TolQ
MNTFIIAFTQSDVFGKLIMLALIALSMICWILLLHKAYVVRQVVRLSSDFEQAVERGRASLLSLEMQTLPMPKTAAIPHPFAQIFATLKAKTVEVLNKNHFFLTEKPGAKVYLTAADLELLEAHVGAHILVQSKMLEKNLYILSTIVTLAPFIGLLGTVWGILVTFSGLQGGGAVSSNSSILGGLSTALATTVLGLVIAIPALVAYNYLRNSLKNYVLDMDNFLTKLLSQIELQYRKVE